MLTTSAVKDYLKLQYPAVTIYNGSIDKSKEQCLGIYPRGSAAPVMALGGIQNSSYNILPVSILVHWTKNTKQCEEKANELYMFLISSSGASIGGKRIISFQMQDSCPVDLQRDENGICEMVIRVNIIYER